MTTHRHGFRPSDAEALPTLAARADEAADSDASRDKSTRIAVAEVCAGVGSVAAGFERSGKFRTAFLNDIDAHVERTWRRNNDASPTHYEVAPMEGLRPEQIREVVGDSDPLALLGCPPCQGWSTAGRRAAADPRNLLLGNFFDLVGRLEPVVFVMENVPRVASRPEFALAVGALSGYRVWSGVLNAAQYGLPQTRQRTVAIGFHRDLGISPRAPQPTHGVTESVWSYPLQRSIDPAEAAERASVLGAVPTFSSGRGEATREPAFDPAPDLQPVVTVGQAIGDLTDDPTGSESSAYARALGAGAVTEQLGTPSGMEPWGHNPDMVARMRAVPPGGSPEAGSRRYFSQAYARLHRDGLARTITTNLHNPGSGRFTHYAQPRTLTLREAARLQGFADDFEFVGPRSKQAQMIGNAFPPLWAEALGREVAAQLDGRI